MTDDACDGGEAVARELVIGLVTPVGTNTEELAASVRTSLSRRGYTSHVVKLSSLMPQPAAPVGEPEDHRVRRLIKAGNDYCARLNGDGDPAALARLAVKEIRAARVAQHRADGANGTTAELSGTPANRRAYIIHSLKRPAEIMFLRGVYGDQFVLLGSQGTPSERLENLKLRALSVSDAHDVARVAQDLMSLDAADIDPNGQQVNKAYPLADFFLRGPNAERAIALLFGDPRVPPDPGDYAMFVAKATAARSLAGSRKVGAALVRDGSLIATGYNDVPLGQTPDVVAGSDTSEVLKRQNVAETVLRLINRGLLTGPNSEVLVEKVIAALEGGELMSIIEYQRAVHAEASTLDDAAVRGVITADADLYVTTFPCHLCYKHALSARVAIVRYIDPYSKSRAREMFPEGSEQRLVPYEGVAPRAYLRVFGERPAPVSSGGAFGAPTADTAVPLFPNPRSETDIDREERLAVNPLNEEKP